jgi:hypothetical protein
MLDLVGMVGQGYLCRLANLLANDLPFVGIVLLDSGEQSCTLFLFRQHMHTKIHISYLDPPRLLQTRRSAYPAKVVVSERQYRIAKSDNLPCTSVS